MTIIALVPALVALVSALVYALSTNAKIVELARIAFFCGLFVFMLTLSATHVRI